MSNQFTAKWIPPILAYCSASICMTLTNKLVLSGFKFKLPFLVLSVQAISSVLLLESFTLVGLTQHRKFNMTDAKACAFAISFCIYSINGFIAGFPVSILMAIMLYTGSKSLQYLPVPIFTIFKNISIILVAYGESRVFGGHVTIMMLFSFCLMVFSSIIAAFGDLSFSNDSVSYNNSIIGYWWMAFNCISSATFVIFMRYTLKKPSRSDSPPFKDFDTVFFNNLLTSPMFLMFSLMGADGNTDEFWDYYNNPLNVAERNYFFYSVIFSGISAFWISYASSWCMRVTNSTTYSMVGALNKLPIALSSLIFFNDTAISVYSVGSILLGFISGVIYTFAKLNYDQEQKKKMSLPVSSSEFVRIDKETTE